MIRMAGNRPKKKVGNTLVAMGSAAVMAVYGAGYQRTRTAAGRKFRGKRSPGCGGSSTAAAAAADAGAAAVRDGAPTSETLRAEELHAPISAIAINPRTICAA